MANAPALSTNSEGWIDGTLRVTPTPRAAPERCATCGGYEFHRVACPDVNVNLALRPEPRCVVCHAVKHEGYIDHEWVPFTPKQPCAKCGGNGSDYPDTERDCPECDGKGTAPAQAKEGV